MSTATDLLYKRQRDRARRAAKLCRVCGNPAKAGIATCEAHRNTRRNVELRPATYELVRKAAVRRGVTMRALLTEIIEARLAKAGR